MKTPYEALDRNGSPYIREARTIRELPTSQDRIAALKIATPAVAKVLGMKPADVIGFGCPVFRSFGFTDVRQVRSKPYQVLLEMLGEDLPLTFVDS